MDDIKVKNYNCYFELTLDVIGGKWKPIIMYYVGKKKNIRYSELKRCIVNINERMLTKQLRELEKDKLIHREIFKEIPPRVEYSLTDIGETVLPILEDLRNWGVGYNEKTKRAEFLLEKNCSALEDK